MGDYKKHHSRRPGVEVLAPDVFAYAGGGGGRKAHKPPNTLASAVL